MSARPCLLAMLVASMLTLGSAAAAQGAQAWAADQATVGFVITHKLHRVEGRSDRAQIRAVWEDGTFKVMAQAPSQSFGTGNANRDQHMLEVIEAARYPAVVVKAVGKVAALPTANQSVTTQARGEVDLHGQKQLVNIAVTLKAIDDASVRVDFSFTTSLTDHRIQRPALLFVPIDDALSVRGSITVAKQ